jgi:hypothetical protein
MLDKARNIGHIRGLVQNLLDGGITHLQYADDTVIFLSFEEQTLLRTKFIFFCFEKMSGLKINFQKSDVVVVGGSDEEQN